MSTWRLDPKALHSTLSLYFKTRDVGFGFEHTEPYHTCAYGHSTCVLYLFATAGTETTLVLRERRAFSVPCGALPMDFVVLVDVDTLLICFLLPGKVQNGNVQNMHDQDFGCLGNWHTGMKAVLVVRLCGSAG